MTGEAERGRRSRLDVLWRLPRWPLVALAAGWLVAGPAGLAVAAGLAGALLVLRLRMAAADPDLPKLPPRRQGPAPPLPGFTRTVSAVEWGMTSPADFDTTLRPRLTRVLAARLAERHGVDLHRDPAAAGSMVDEELWTYLDPARPASRDRDAPGPDHATLTRLLDAIERV